MIRKPWIGFAVAMAAAYSFTVCQEARAQSVVEGVVKLPTKQQHRRTSGRYHVLTAGKVGVQEGARAVVYLESVAAKARVVASDGELRQSKLRFIPELLPITVGGTVTFPNLDDEYHNVLSYSFAKEFDLGRYLKTAPKPTVKFDEPGVVEVNCEIHEHMRAYILVLETPYFTITKTDGRFKLKNVPAGQYTLKAWLNDRLEYKTTIECVADETTTVNVGGT